MQPADNKTIEVNGDLVANISSMPMALQGELETNSSSISLQVNWELIANVSTNRMDVNGPGSANISGSRTVELYEGRDVTLTFVMEAYPPIRNQHWTTPTNVNIGNKNTVYQKSYAAIGYRSAY